MSVQTDNLKALFEILGAVQNETSEDFIQRMTLSKDSFPIEGHRPIDEVIQPDEVDIMNWMALQQQRTKLPFTFMRIGKNTFQLLHDVRDKFPLVTMYLAAEGLEGNMFFDSLDRVTGGYVNFMALKLFSHQNQSGYRVQFLAPSEHVHIGVVDDELQFSFDKDCPKRFVTLNRFPTFFFEQV